MNVAADINILPLTVRGVDLAADGQGKCEAGAVSERQACVSRGGPEIGGEARLRFGERFTAREQTEERANARIFRQSEIVDLRPDLGEVHRAHCSAFDSFLYFVVELLILQDGKQD